MYFSGHHPAQPSIDDDVPRVRRDDAHVVAWFELRSVLNHPFIQLTRPLNSLNSAPAPHGCTEPCARARISSTDRIRSTLKDKSSPWIKATKGSQDLASKRTPRSLMTIQQSQSA